jgi:hypothetical protein
MPGQQHVAMDTAPELFLGEVLGFLGGQAAALETTRIRDEHVATGRTI